MWFSNLYAQAYEAIYRLSCPHYLVSVSRGLPWHRPLTLPLGPPPPNPSLAPAPFHLPWSLHPGGSRSTQLCPWAPGTTHPCPPWKPTRLLDKLSLSMPSPSSPASGPRPGIAALESFSLPPPLPIRPASALARSALFLAGGRGSHPLPPRHHCILPIPAPHPLRPLVMASQASSVWPHTPS